MSESVGPPARPVFFDTVAALYSMTVRYFRIMCLIPCPFGRIHQKFQYIHYCKSGPLSAGYVRLPLVIWGVHFLSVATHG